MPDEAQAFFAQLKQSAKKKVGKGLRTELKQIVKRQLRAICLIDELQIKTTAKPIRIGVFVDLEPYSIV
jgi:hypothetical protein